MFVCLQGFTSLCGCVVQRGKTEHKHHIPNLNPLWTAPNKVLSFIFLTKTSGVILQEDIFQLTYRNAPGLMKMTLIQQAKKKKKNGTFGTFHHELFGLIFLQEYFLW